MATVLERLGFSVDFPEAQTCCGQPAFNSGYRDEARIVAEHTMKVLDGADLTSSLVGFVHLDDVAPL